MAAIPLTRHVLARLYTAQGDWALAEEQLRILDTLEPDGIETHLDWAEFYRLQGDFDKAEGEYIAATNAQIVAGTLAGSAGDRRMQKFDHKRCPYAGPVLHGCARAGVRQGLACCATGYPAEAHRPRLARRCGLGACALRAILAGLVIAGGSYCSCARRAALQVPSCPSIRRTGQVRRRP